MFPRVKAFFDEVTNTLTYVLEDPHGKACVIIDPVLDFDPVSGRTSTASADEVIKYIRNNSLNVVWILETHIHAGVTEQEFVDFRSKRDKQLGMPKLILPSIQVNIRAGEMPPADDNGVVYLKLPVDAL